MRLRMLVKAVAALFASTVVVLALAMVAGIFLPSARGERVYAAKAVSDDTVSVYVASNGWHTSLVLPRRNEAFDWDAVVSPADVTSDEKARESGRWVVFGWGEEEFFARTPRLADFSLKLAIHSLFFSEKFVLQIGYERGIREGESVRRLVLSREEYTRLVGYVNGFLLKDERGGARRVVDGYTPHDAFFASGGNYAPAYTCNTWVAGGLREIGVPTPLWAGSALAVMWHLPRHPVGFAAKPGGE